MLVITNTEDHHLLVSTKLQYLVAEANICVNKLCGLITRKPDGHEFKLYQKTALRTFLKYNNTNMIQMQKIGEISIKFTGSCRFRHLWIMISSI